MLEWMKIRLRALLRKNKMERELDEEMSLHLERMVEQNIAQGMMPEDARRAALRDFGGLEQAKENCRDARGVRPLEELWQDLRYGFRMLVKKPGFTFVILTTLAIGIGANTAIFSVMNAILLRPLPFEDPERIVNLFSTKTQSPDARGEFSYPDFVDYKTQSQMLEYIAIYLNSGTVLSGPDEPERVTGADVSAELFPILGVQPLLGRVFTPEEDRIGVAPVVVLSYELWQSHFGGEHNVIGQTVKMAGNRTVIGVMPPGFKFPLDTNSPIQYWMPIHDPSMASYESRRDLIGLPLIAKLKTGVTADQAQAELRQIAASLEAEHPASNTDRSIRVASLHTDLVREIKPALLVLFGTVGFVLLIACANVANLLLSRADARAKEIAIRAAIGASRARIVRQLLVECFLLSFLGGVAAVLLATWGLDLLISISPADLPRIREVSLDKSVLIFTFLISVLAGLLFGLMPALQASKINLSDVMKEGSKGSSVGGGRKRVRSAFVVVEVALSVVLVIGAGLLIKSFIRLTSTELGYEPDGVLLMDLPLSPSKYPKPEQRIQFFQQIIEHVNQLPGVVSAGATNLLPMGGRDIVQRFNVEGRAPGAPGNVPRARYQLISPSYFGTMKMPMRKGRAFTDQDAVSSPQVLVINEEFARHYFPDEDPIGRRVIWEDEEMAPREIIGIVGDVKQIGLDQDVVPIAYISYLQDPPARMDLVIRSMSEASDIAPAVRGAIKEMNRDQLIWQTRTMNELVGRSLAPRRFNMVLLGAFALIALVLAATGIFGVMSSMVTQRSHEIGVRLALGAQKGRIIKLVVGHGMLLTLMGVSIGLVAAFALTRLISNLLFGVKATDPSTFVVIPLIITAVGLLACWIPARRATKVDPMVALRYE